MLKRLLCAALAAATLAIPTAQAFPEPTGVDGEDAGFWAPFFGGGGDEGDPYDDEADLGTLVITPDEGGGYIISLGPLIVFVDEGTSNGSPAPEQWGDTEDQIRYCLSYPGDAICGG